MNGINHCFPLLQCLGQAKKYIHMEYCKISAVDKCVHLILREGDISSLGTKTQNFRYIFGVLRWGPSFFSRQHQKVELLNWSFPPQIGCGFSNKNGDSSCENRCHLSGLTAWLGSHDLPRGLVRIPPSWGLHRIRHEELQVGKMMIFRLFPKVGHVSSQAGTRNYTKVRNDHVGSFGCNTFLIRGWFLDGNIWDPLFWGLPSIG